MQEDILPARKRKSKGKIITKIEQLRRNGPGNSCEGSPGGRSETTGVGFVKKVGFKPGVEEKGSYGGAEW